MGAQAGGPTLIQSVQRALRLLEVLAEHSGRARAKELARADRAPARHDVPPAAHLRPRGLAAATGRRFLRPGPPDRRRPGAGDGGPRRRARATGAGVAARRARRCGVPGPLDRRRDRGHRDRRQRAGTPDRPVGRAARRRARDGAGQVHPRPAAARRPGRLPQPATRSTTSPRGPSSTGAGCCSPRPDEIAVDDGEYAVGVSCLAAAAPTPEALGAVGVVTTPARHGQGRGPPRPAGRRRTGWPAP